MSKAIVPALISLLFLKCTQQHKVDSNENLAKLPAIHDSVFFSPFSGYGYDIIVDGKVAIHQPHIPVISLRLGFASASDAKRTARVVIAKLKQNQFPPQITKTELKQLGIVR